VPLAVAALAYALWWMSDRLLYVGPLDRASSGWLVVIPVWLAIPIAGAFAWRRIAAGESLLAAATVGLIVTGGAALLLWQGIALADCEFGAIRAPVEWVLPSILLGGIIGGGVALSTLLAAGRLRAGHPRSGVAVGLSVQIVSVLTAILVAALLLGGPGCQRPPA
jgi:hypothetical protein